MSAAARLPAIIAGISTVTAVSALLLTPRQHLPQSIASSLPANLRSNLLRLLGLVFLALNVKNIPTSWHIRVLRAIQYQIYASPTTLSGKDLFRPLVTTTRNSLLDCDYNLHKSNSTYFKDLDVSRAHFVGALLRTGLRRLNAGDEEGLGLDGRGGAVQNGGSTSKVPDRWIIALGGVACVFRKEIKPLAKFEIWTRLLSWDDKWIYVVSHVVRAGAVKHEGYALQPWRKQRQGRWWWSLFGGGSRKSQASRAGPEPKTKAAGQVDNNEDMRRAIYATSIAKYVCKKGRLTVPPEAVLARSRLLPRGPKPAPRPAATSPAPSAPLPAGEASDLSTRSEADLLLISRRGLGGDNGAGSAGGADTPASSTAGLEGPESSSLSDLAAVTGSNGGGAAQSEDMPASSRQGPGKTAATASQEEDTLSWEVIEKLRTAGLKYAQQLDGLTGLHDEFGRNEGPGDDVADGGGSGAREVLGVYGDFVY